VADAYYVLSDPKRRKEYDALYASQSSSNRTNDPTSSSSFFSQFTGMFGGSGATTGQGRPDAEGVFADVFEEVIQKYRFGVKNATHDIIRYSCYGQRLSSMLLGGVISEPSAAVELASSLQMYLAL
jgi:curved DNA-binding protein CbpA